MKKEKKYFNQKLNEEREKRFKRKQKIFKTKQSNVWTMQVPVEENQSKEIEVAKN